MKRYLALSLAVVLLSLAQPTSAGIIVTIDENGNGSAVIDGVSQQLKEFFLTDPTTINFTNPLGIATLAYILPLAPQQGDLLLREPGRPHSLRSDLIRFLSSPHHPNAIFFYSDIQDPRKDTDLADVGFPGNKLRSHITVVENGSEDANGFTYTPKDGQPGFVQGGITYVIMSDVGVVPEPSSVILLGPGTLSLLGFFARRRWKQSVAWSLWTTITQFGDRTTLG
jgi:hypothetical protein